MIILAPGKRDSHPNIDFIFLLTAEVSPGGAVSPVKTENRCLWLSVSEELCYSCSCPHDIHHHLSYPQVTNKHLLPSDHVFPANRGDRI